MDRGALGGGAALSGVLLAQTLRRPLFTDTATAAMQGSKGRERVEHAFAHCDRPAVQA